MERKAVSDFYWLKTSPVRSVSTAAKYAVSRLNSSCGPDSPYSTSPPAWYDYHLEIFFPRLGLWMPKPQKEVSVYCHTQQQQHTTQSQLYMIKKIATHPRCITSRSYAIRMARETQRYLYWIMRGTPLCYVVSMLVCPRLSLIWKTIKLKEAGGCYFVQSSL